MNIVSKMPQQTIVDASEIASITKIKKGKNVVIEEERQLCCIFFHVSQDPTIGIN
jgi:hypothetical protein